MKFIGMISIHVPREGHDLCVLRFSSSAFLFQSTCPARGTTVPPDTEPISSPISIHVPREGHDANGRPGSRSHNIFQSTCPARGTTRAALHLRRSRRNFNPRAPRGARRADIERHFRQENAFQSTCPARGTTIRSYYVYLLQPISIHVPREGHDPRRSHRPASRADFNPRAPRGARRGFSLRGGIVIPISIHVPREGHDRS